MKIANALKAFVDYSFWVGPLICILVFTCSWCFKTPTEANNYWQRWHPQDDQSATWLVCKLAICEFSSNPLTTGPSVPSTAMSSDCNRVLEMDSEIVPSHQLYVIAHGHHKWVSSGLQVSLLLWESLMDGTTFANTSFTLLPSKPSSLYWTEWDQHRSAFFHRPMICQDVQASSIPGSVETPHRPMLGRYNWP